MKASYALYLAILACAIAGDVSLAQSPGGERSKVEAQLGAPQAMRGAAGMSNMSGMGGRGIIASGPGHCGPGGPGGFGGIGGHHGPGVPDMAFIKSLQLTDAQREQLHAIREQVHLAAASRHVEIMKLQHQLMEGVSSGALGKTQALDLQSQINVLESAGRNERVALMVDIGNVFTPEQRKLMRKHMLEHEPIMPGGPPMGPMGGPPMGPMGLMDGPMEMAPPPMAMGGPMGGPPMDGLPMGGPMGEP